MNGLPFKAKLFIFGVYTAGIAAILITYFVLPLTPARGELWELLLLTVAGAVGGRIKVELMRVKGDAEPGSMSLGFAIVFASLLRFGPQGALVVSIVSTLFSCLWPRKQPWYQTLFNVSVCAFEMLVAGIIFLRLNQGTLELQLFASIPAVVAASFAFFLVNTGIVALIIGLCSDDNPYVIWRESFLWTSPSYFIASLVSTTLVALLGDNFMVTLLCTVPVASLTYLSYKNYMERAKALLNSKEQLADLYQETVRSLALAIDAKDQYTHQHILRVQRYAVAIAKQMNIDGDLMNAIETGALLHDIGKLGVPEYVLLKPGRLTDDEFAKIKEHPRIGADILDPVAFPWPVTPIVKYHHERMDGSGYPEGLKGEEIPLTARILAVADVYDAMTSTRSYRNAWPHEKAVEEILAGSGTLFDPNVVEAFQVVIDEVVADMKKDTATDGAVIGPGVMAAGGTKMTTARADEAARDIQRASSELWALYEVAQTLSASLGLQDTLDILGRKLEAILPGTACVFLLRDQEANALVARAAVGINRPFFEGSRTLDQNSLSVRVAHDCATYMGSFDPQDILPQSQPTEPWTEIKTALIVPIIHQGEVLGTINLYHPMEHAFGAHDQYLLETIAERAAMALYNGLLFDRTRSHAITDPLTGLANVRHFTQCVEDRCKLVSDGHSRKFAILCLDLDSFKPINDNFGHQKGDKVLSDLGGVFQNAVRRSDLVARYGGDEFLVLLDDAGPDTAETMAQRLEEAVQRYDPGLFHPRLGALRIGVSVGCACYPSDGMDCATLLTVADVAMYRLKTERKLGQLAEPRNYNFAFSTSSGKSRALDPMPIEVIEEEVTAPRISSNGNGNGSSAPPLGDIRDMT